MNQILMTENKNEKNSKKTSTNIFSGHQFEIKGIVMFFAVAIMIYGLTLVGEGSYAICKDLDNRNPKNIPIVNLARINDELIIKVKHKDEISKIKYSWNDESSTTLPTDKEKEVEEKIELPKTDSILNIVIQDVKGRETIYQKEYKVTGMDTIKPQVEISYNLKGKELIIKAKDDVGIAEISYKIEGKEKITKKANGEKEKIEKIKLEETGIKTIYIKVKDISGNFLEEESKISISKSKPKVFLEKGNNDLFLKFVAEDGIKNVIVNINNKEVIKSENINAKEYKKGIIKYLKKGKNIISIKITNINENTIEPKFILNY